MLASYTNSISSISSLSSGQLIKTDYQTVATRRRLGKSPGTAQGRDMRTPGRLVKAFWCLGGGECITADDAAEMRLLSQG